MRDLGDSSTSGSASAVLLPTCADVDALTTRLAGRGAGLDDVERIDLIRSLEVLKCAAEGAQAVLAADFDRSQRAVTAAAGVGEERQGRGIAAQVALARRESIHRGQRHLGLAVILGTELPHTLAALRAGRISEWKATVIARETACLSLPDRLEVDVRLGGDPTQLEAMGERELADTARALACALDPASIAERRRRAEADRHTTVRPAPDTMTWFTALLPVKDGVAVHAALLREADRLRSDGDPRSRGAIMADTLVTRVLAPTIAATGGPPLLIHVLIPDDVLLGDNDGTGWVEGYGEVPGDLLREWIAEHAETGVQDWVKRLYATPATGALVAMDRAGRRFDGALAEFLRLRDRRCRTPWCDAPIRHLDHAHEAADGGPTSAANAQGLCEACNHAKQAHGWTARPRPGPRHTIETTTPTGHHYTSPHPRTTCRPHTDRASTSTPSRSTSPDHGPALGGSRRGVRRGRLPRTEPLSEAGCVTAHRSARICR